MEEAQIGNVDQEGIWTVDIITTATMNDLLGEGATPAVSVFLPTHRSGRETAQDPIRLKNLLDTARQDLEQSGIRPPEASALLEDAEVLIQEGTFWQYQEEGLAVFVNPAGTRTFRVPIEFPELVTVGDTFHTKPLWPVVTGGNEVFYLLALSRNLVRLLWVDRFRVGDIDLPDDIPRSLAEALWFEDPEKQLQHHGSGRTGQGRVTAAFHGHGVPEERGEARLEAFLRAVDQGVGHLIETQSPLVLAGVEEITGLYRKVSKHGNLLDDTIGGNPDLEEPRRLHEKALPVLEPLLRQTFEEDAAAFRGAGELATSDVGEATQAAHAGRVASLTVPVGIQVWGRIHADTHEVEIHDEWEPGDRDLLDAAASAAWLTGARIHAVAPDEIPGPGPLAAVLRY